MHIPVLLKEVVENITVTKRDPVLLDGTLGEGGHSLAIAKALNGNVSEIGLDMDTHAIDTAGRALNGKVAKLVIENENFRNLDKVLDRNSMEKVDMIILDLGVSSPQLDSSGRGFSFGREEPLHMTMGEPAKYPFTARTIVNHWNEEDISNVIFGYGEERFARRIARAIVNYRVKKPIETSAELAEIVRMSVPAFYRRGKINPATRTFQAIRIAVNDELGALREGLTKGYDRLSKGGRMAIISFHSLEDRIVKEFFRQKSKSDDALIVTKKPIRPSEEEISNNPRSRSAKLRIIQKQK